MAAWISLASSWALADAFGNDDDEVLFAGLLGLAFIRVQDVTLQIVGTLGDEGLPMAPVAMPTFRAI